MSGYSQQSAKLCTWVQFPHRPQNYNIMLKIDKKYSEKFLPGLEVKSEMISPYKGFRLYSYEQNRFMYIETELGKGIVKEHILDPFKGYSNDYYRSITLYSKERSDILDGLSTALFNIDNLDNIKKIITNVETNYNIKIDYLIQKEINDNTLELYYNDGFKNTIIKYNGNDTTVDGITRVEL